MRFHDQVRSYSVPLGGRRLCLPSVVRVLLVIVPLWLGMVLGFEVAHQALFHRADRLHEATQDKARALARALESERLGTGSCASGLTELALEGYAPLLQSDPWGTRWRLRCYGERGVVESAGPDRRFGTDDDVVALTPGDDY